MATQKTATVSEVVAAILIAGAALIGGHLALDYDPALAPVIAGGAILLLTGLLAFFASRPF